MAKVWWEWNWNHKVFTYNTHSPNAHVRCFVFASSLFFLLFLNKDRLLMASLYAAVLIEMKWNEMVHYQVELCIKVIKLNQIYSKQISSKKWSPKSPSSSPKQILKQILRAFPRQTFRCRSLFRNSKQKWTNPKQNFSALHPSQNFALPDQSHPVARDCEPEVIRYSRHKIWN